jgi:hypothetical protein
MQGFGELTAPDVSLRDAGQSLIDAKLVKPGKSALFKLTTGVVVAGALAALGWWLATHL